MSIQISSQTTLDNGCWFACTGEHGLRSNYAVNQFDLFDLAGGVGGQKDVLFQCTVELNSFSATVDIKSSKHECTRIINFEDKSISNEYCRATKMEDTGKGFGKLVFNTQLLAARKFDFKKITLQATGGDVSGWNGHYTWGRFGFEMINADEINKFKRFCIKYDRNEETLLDLLQSQSGRQLWLNNGFSWRGAFEVNEKSSCSRNFEKYLKGNY